MRAVVLLALVLTGCRPSEPPAPESRSESPAAVVSDPPPWSLGTANKKLVGLTDDELKSLVGKPGGAGPDMRGPGREIWAYEGAWLKAPEGTGGEARGMNVVLRAGKVIEVSRR